MNVDHLERLQRLATWIVSLSELILWGARENYLKLHLKRFRLNRRKTAFFFGIVGSWNSQPSLSKPYLLPSSSRDWAHVGLTCSPALFSVLPLRFPPSYDSSLVFSAITAFQQIKIASDNVQSFINHKSKDLINSHGFYIPADEI